MSRSSTSSSEGGTARRSFLKAVVLTLLVLVATEVLVARSDWVWRAPVDNSFTAVPVALERVTLRGREQPPVVVVIGSSRTATAISPARLAHHLGLRADQVLNLSMPQTSPWDVIWFYRRNRDHLRQAEVCVIGLEEWIGSGSWDGYWARVIAYGSFEEQLRLAPVDGRPRAWLSATWRSYAALPPAGIYGSRLVMSSAPLTYAAMIDEEGRYTWEGRGERPPRTEWLEGIPKSFRDQGDYEGEWVPTRVHFDQLAEAIRLLEADGLKVALYRPPLCDVYCDLLETHYPQAMPWFLANVEAMGRPAQIGHRASEWGMPETMFSDYGHHTPAGEAFLTERLAAFLQREGLGGPAGGTGEERDGPSS
ncbi:MAG: hypothetical protein GF320_15100 [Armatimonadia bacterium]|nr:hypothetical protein [Armatimonadia bacterium]